MTRIGFNPARQKVSSYRPQRVSVGMVTYVPHLEGYFRERLDVLKLSLASLQAAAPTAETRPYDLFVFDNGSCPEATAYLHELYSRGEIDYLILSKRNLGKIGAFKILFNAMPGEIAAYSDDDILFYPGWLQATLTLLETYPEAGMVSAAPVRNAATYAVRSVRALADRTGAGVMLREERCIPDAWEDDWAASTGRDPEEHRKGMAERKDLVIERGGVQAVAGANHFQFAARRQVLLDALPQEWSGKLMGQMVELDEAIDRKGLLRISTTERLARHIGNAISPELMEEVRSMGLSIDLEERTPPSRKTSLLVRIPGLRRFLFAVYDRLFRILNEVE